MTGKTFGYHREPPAGFRPFRRTSVHARHDGHHPEPGPERSRLLRVWPKKTDNPRFAYDCYRRFIQMYSDVVMELGKSFFEERIDAMKERKGVKQDVELDADDLKELVKELQADLPGEAGRRVPAGSPKSS